MGAGRPCVNEFGRSHDRRREGIRDLAASHAGYTPDATHSRVTPLYQTTAYTFDGAQRESADLFALRESGNIYTRLQNPTTDMLEKRVAALGGRTGRIGRFRRGIRLSSFALTSILSPGDNFVSSPYLYGGTHNQFKIVRCAEYAARVPASRRTTIREHMESLIDPRTPADAVSRRSAIRASPCPISARFPRLHGVPTTFR